MKRHLVNCSKASTHSQQDAIRSQAKRSASDISEAGSQQSGSSDKASWVLVQQTAGGLWKDGYKNSKQAVQQLITDMKRYKIHDAPFDSMPADGELATLTLYWKSISSSNEQLELPKLALLLLDIKPHAADPWEKTVSLMGWYHSARRSQLLSRTTTAMTTIKMHYQPVKDG